MTKKINFAFDRRIKNGYYTAAYFNKTTKLAKKYKPLDIVCLQFIHFTHEPVKICGISEIVALLKQTIPPLHLKQIKVYGRKDGDLIKANQPVLLIIGPYHLFGYLENIIDGILARRTSVCNNCYQVLKLIKSSQLIYMADRTDDYLLQPFDGYAAYLAGVRQFVTDASASLIKNDPTVKVTGTMPHALIQLFDGKLNDALNAYIKEFGSKNAIALIDYHNDIEQEIKLLAKQFKHLFAVRLDTSGSLVDKSLLRHYHQQKNNSQIRGVNPLLVKHARKLLDAYGLPRTKIIVSSGIDVTKIKNFIAHHAPVDFYGIGSSLITRNVHFTADLVLKNNKRQAKYGRKLFIDINKIKNLCMYI
ncbi:MAG: nicotinate phosphoribosyltransferase [Mycoplasmataceae bacterium]|jgi:nicotinate phosphoribosyltransferase|nr:nicotinate phosphoribosyltransferase [Mycoplasmataceae bacterium]